MVLPLLIPAAKVIAGFAASVVIPLIIDHFTSADDPKPEDFVDEVEKLPLPEQEQVVEVLRDQDFINTVVENYHIPASELKRLRTEINNLNAEQAKHANVRDQASERKYDAISHINDQVTGIQRKRVMDAADSYKRDEKTAIENVNKLGMMIANKQTDLDTLNDIQSRPVTDLNDIAMMQIANDTGVNIVKEKNIPSVVKQQIQEDTKKVKNQ